MRRRSLMGFMMAAAMAATLTPATVRAEETLRIGVVPHTSARVVLEMYQPLREQLEAELGHKVEIQTAPDFSSFARRALDREYDIAITTGHQARLLQQDAGYLPLVTYEAEFRAVMVVAELSPIRRPENLTGKTIIGLGPTSLVTQWGQHWIAEHGIADIQTRYVSAADSVAQLLLTDEAAIGLMSNANFHRLAPDVQARLRLFARSEPMLGRVYMLNGALADHRAKILAALHAFAASPAGKSYFNGTSLIGYRLVTPQELAAMDPFALEVRNMLATEKP
ncbi:phosphate/phosphite/phosphonate ABC transporter substrate-binding protein [Magnetospirillum molischianum]|uniref:ABC-type phosphate/phosphonate transport system periplasmic component-like protein n=1 Tax=Magnetospirillum molischianum DSM 120 TaxID=1150626 RepID=H8FNU3_MAGML|nr:phosphate/phosphite/phosphonate ABC transporter substrate-binding protein [Magnetospirillum molischianum]CCG40031.1 ABC-type phosphate/phosphonate transport system periplasmic component-like protein [Magnetospirillum molischianum DSM 120]